MSQPSSAFQPASLASYDEIPYPSASFPQSHPSRLAAMGRLFGLEPKSPSEARVLELGCADGSNILPMAEMAPKASFLGIDGSAAQIAAGRKSLDASGLANVELRHQDLMHFSTQEGKFDFIVVHGVFSWVSEQVREKILTICNEHLSEQGIAYISYNTLPGWNMRRSLRDMVQYHTQRSSDWKFKVQQARALISFLAESIPAENNAYGLIVRNELAIMQNAPDGYLRHDLLGDEVTSFYFHEFSSLADKHGLQYLGEPGIAQMLAGNFPEKVRETLAKIGNDIVAQEQYMDFLRNRAFRETLLCRSSLRIRRRLSPDDLRQFSFRANGIDVKGAVDLTPGTTMMFTTTTGSQMSATDTFVKALFLKLAECGACAIPYARLLEAVRFNSRPHLADYQTDRSGLEDATLASNLLNLFSKGIIDLYAEPVEIAVRLPEKPAVSRLARHQAVNCRFVTNRIHQGIPVDALTRYVMAACDGTLTPEGILVEVTQAVIAGKLKLSADGQQITDPEMIRTHLKPRIESVLNGLMLCGYFDPEQLSSKP